MSFCSNRRRCQVVSVRGTFSVLGGTEVHTCSSDSLPFKAKWWRLDVSVTKRLIVRFAICGNSINVEMNIDATFPQRINTRELQRTPQTGKADRVKLHFSFKIFKFDAQRRSTTARITECSTRSQTRSVVAASMWGRVDPLLRRASAGKFSVRVKSVVENFNFPLAICWCSATTLAAGPTEWPEAAGHKTFAVFWAPVSSLQTSLVPLGRHRSCIGVRGRCFRNLVRKRRKTSLAEQVAVQTCSGLFHRDKSGAGGSFVLGLRSQDKQWLADLRGGLHEDHPVRDELFDEVPHKWRGQELHQYTSWDGNARQTLPQ